MSSEIVPDQILEQNPDRSDAYQWGLTITLGMRIVLGVIMAATWLAARPSLGVANIYDPQVYGEIEIPDTFLGDTLLGVWPRWDGVHYLNLAILGYVDAPPGDSVYYPLYVILTRIFTVVSGNVILGGLIVSTLATFFSFVFLYRLAETYGTQTARWSVLVLAVYPTAVFLIAPFTESLFLALTLGAFIAFYRQRWWLGGVLGFFASLARGPGAFTVLSFAIIVWQWWRTIKPARPNLWQIFSIAISLLLPIVGSLAFIVWRHIMGFASMTEILQQYSGLILSNPISGLVAGVQQWIRVRDFNSTIDVVSAAVFIVLTALMAFKAEWRKPEWIVYLIVNLCLFLSKESLIASSLQSMSRYVLILFPVFIAAGHWLAHHGQRTRFYYLVVSGLIEAVFAMLYTLWVFIG